MEWKRNTRERIRRGEKVQERGKKPETEIEEMKRVESDYEREKLRYRKTESN